MRRAFFRCLRRLVADVGWLLVRAHTPPRLLARRCHKALCRVARARSRRRAARDLAETGSYHPAN